MPVLGFWHPQGSRLADCAAIRLPGKRSAAVGGSAGRLGPALGSYEAGEQFVFGTLHRLRRR